MAFGRRGRLGLLATAARTAVIAGTAQAVTGLVAARQQEAALPAQPPPNEVTPVPVPAPAGGDDLIAQLERLGQLHAAGVLTPDEFAAAKARLLS